MANRAPSSDPVRELYSDVLSHNPDLRARATAIVTQLLNHMERTIKIGDPRDMAVYTKQVIPSLLKSMQQADDEGEREDRLAHDRMMAMLRGETDE